MSAKAVILTLMLGISVATGAQADSASKKPPRSPKASVWALEPEAILGIKIGAPLSESVPACPVDAHGLHVEPQPTTMCWVRLTSKNVYEIENTPGPGIRIWDVLVETVGGTVEYVSFTFRYLDHMDMAELLKARYGAPTSVRDNTVQNRMGATFNQQVLEWSGPNVELVYESRSGRVDEGAVTLTTRRWLESKKFDAEANKGKL